MPALTQERARQLFDYDPETGVIFHKRLRRPITQTNQGYIRVSADGKPYQAHRVIWLMVHGEWPNVIDHIDRNRLNNKLENLRNASLVDNAQNRSVRKDNRTGCPGVYFYPKTGGYRVQLQVNGRRLSVGYFRTQDQAQAAYFAAKRTHHIPSAPYAGIEI